MIPYFEQPHFGPIHTFGILLAIGIYLSHIVYKRRMTFAGLDVQVGDRLVFTVLTAGFIGAHLVDRFVYFPRETLNDPLSIIKIWQGISSFGGFLGAITAAILYVRSGRLQGRTWEYLDAIAFAFPFGWFFGRLGCFSAFDHPGLPTNFILGQDNGYGIHIHNLGLEEALYTIPLALLFARLGRARRFSGFYVGLLPVLYSPVRFLYDFLRARDVRYFGFTPGQYGAIGLLITGILILRWRRSLPAAASTPPAGGQPDAAAL